MTTPDCPDGCAIRDEATARADYILHTRTELDRVRAERDQLAAAIGRIKALHVRYDEFCAAESEDWPCPTIRALSDDTAPTLDAA